MKLNRINILWALLTIAVAQTAVLGWLVFDRIQLLRSPRHIIFKVIPVDPRSIFRGDYVRLGYEAARVPITHVAPLIRKNYRGDLYVVLKKDISEGWSPVAVKTRYEPPKDADHITLKATARGRSRWPGMLSRGEREVNVLYGIEKYFVAEGSGKMLEDAARSKELSVLLAVDGGGRAAIKGLLIDGKQVYEEPLL